MVVLLGWAFLTWSVYKEHAMYLQKLLIALPILKALEVFIFSIYISECPWSDAESQLSAKYLVMALISISTIYQTILLAVLLLLSKGWTLLRVTLTRGQATTLTILMGAIYLSYSAYYVAGTTSSVSYFSTHS